ncbi:MAG TPA: NAD(P)-dependent oxidoreductase [Candidatus Thermoplasmatota archaeon]|nr:NAD(P)-dependent oxidoreductase [Candidatus Thermoplasmatota archaeon]
MKVGVIGAGRMGTPFAENLLSQGHEVVVHTRTPAKARGLEGLGARLAASPREAASPGGMVVTFVPDDAAVETVSRGPGGVIAGLGPGGVHVVASTIAPETARRLAIEHRSAGVGYVAAPVLGRPDAVAARRVWFLVSGETLGRARARDLLAPYAREVYDVGDEPGAANVLKLAANFLLATSLEAMAEAFTLAEKEGVPREEAADLLGRTIFASPVLSAYGRMIADHAYGEGGFATRLGLKDVKLVLESAEAAAAPMPLANLLRHRFEDAVAHGRGQLDWAAIGLEVAEAAGVHPTGTPQ